MSQTSRRMQVLICSFILASAMPSFTQIRVAPEPHPSHYPEGRHPDDRSFTIPDSLSSPEEANLVMKAPIRSATAPYTRHVVLESTGDRFVLVEELDQTWSKDSLAWLNHYRHTTSYNSLGYRMARLTELWFDGAWHNREKSLYTADTIGNETSHWYQLWYRDEYFNEYWLDQWKHVYAYDAQRRVVSDEYQLPGGDHKWIPITRFAYQYDGEGKLLKVYNQAWDGSRWFGLRVITYTYAKGLLARELQQKVGEVDLVNEVQTVYTYDGGNLIEKVWMDWDGFFWNDRGRMLYSRDDRGNIIEVIRQNINTLYLSWENYVRYLYAYDEAGNIIESITQLWGGDRGWRNSWKLSESFRSDGKNLLSRLEEWNGSQWVNNWERRHTYDSDGNCTKEEYFLWYSGWMDYRRLFYTWRRVTDVREDGNVPSQFYLGQNYPNPFNPVTEIRFTVQDAGFTSLRVYDVLGREVATLVDEVKQPGKYTVRWDAGLLPSGVYFYRMTAGRFTDVKKMILIR